MEYYTQEWREEALCRQTDPDLFLPDKGVSRKDIQAAKDVCGHCPVKSPCLEYALEKRYDFGIWGGTTRTERRAILKERDAA